jgi:hypothetical protein
VFRPVCLGLLQFAPFDLGLVATSVEIHLSHANRGQLGMDKVASYFTSMPIISCVL